MGGACSRTPNQTRRARLHLVTFIEEEHTISLSSQVSQCSTSKTQSELKRCALVLERVHFEHVDERAHNGAVVLGDWLDERRQPVHVGLTVRVQKDDHVARSRLRAEDSAARNGDLLVE